MNRKKLALALLLLAFVAAVVWAVWRSPHQEKVTPQSNRPAAPSIARRVVPAQAQAKKREDGGVNLALLDRVLPGYAGYRRNIFSPIFRDEVKLPPVKAIPLPPRPFIPPAPPPPPRAQIPPAPAPPPVDRDAEELAHFTFLGFLSKDGSKTVFIAKDKEIFLVKKGATLAGKFKVTDLNDDAITLTSVQSGRDSVIPLMENRALLPPQVGRRTP